MESLGNTRPTGREHQSRLHARSGDVKRDGGPKSLNFPQKATTFFFLATTYKCERRQDDITPFSVVVVRIPFLQTYFTS